MGQIDLAVQGLHCCQFKLQSSLICLNLRTTPAHHFMPLVSRGKSNLGGNTKFNLSHKSLLLLVLYPVRTLEVILQHDSLCTKSFLCFFAML